MLSAKDIAAVKVAVEICNNPELKREILCAPDDVKKKSHQYDQEQQWNEIIEKKALIILRKLGLPEMLQEKVLGIVLSVGMRMLTWATYYERAFGLSNEYGINFLNSSFFTQQGIIDNKKAAEELMKDKSLSIKQKYKLACLYCFTNFIPDLYEQMEKADKEEVYDAETPITVKQPGLVKFWSYYLMGEVDEIRGGQTLVQYRLEKAVQSGIKTSVEYCLEETNLSSVKDALVDAALEAVSNAIVKKDWSVFINRSYNVRWVSSDYYTDILFFLFSKMSKEQQIEFLKKDIEGRMYKPQSFTEHRRSRVLEYFLSWPYQDYFMKTAQLMWDFLPENSYAILVLNVCDKIKSVKEKNLKYGEEKSYNYRGLLKELWYQSPERYKRHVFSNQEVFYGGVRVKAGLELLIKLLTLENFTYEDRENIKLILASADNEEIENITSSKKWIEICIELIKEEKWEILNRIALNCFSSEEKGDQFKRKLSLTEEARLVCIDFVKNDRWNAAESFMKWSSLPKEEINQLKREMIYSEDGERACTNLFLCREDVEVVNKIIKWCFSSEEEVNEFKKELIYSEGVHCCVCLVLNDKLELADKFISWCIFSQEKIISFKKALAYREGVSICEKLISDYLVEYSYDEEGFTNGCTTIFKGGKWEEVEKFLTWCFSSEKEITFWKKRLLELSGVKVHFNLIKSNRWEEAETFFAWLGLSVEEIKELKKETLFHYEEATLMFKEVLFSVKGDKRFVEYGSKRETIELLLRWYLSDKETVLAFKDYFRSICCDVGGHFDLMIEQHLRDLDKEKMGVKRKSETFSLNKRLCTLKLKNTLQNQKCGKS